MFSRCITLSSEPTTQVTLHFLNQANAEEKPFDVDDTDNVLFKDDYGQIFECRKDLIIGDLIIDIAKRFGAQEEMEILKARAGQKFDQRLEGDPVLKMHIINRQRQAKVRAGENAGGTNMPPLPPNMTPPIITS